LQKGIAKDIVMVIAEAIAVGLKQHWDWDRRIGIIMALGLG